MLTAGRDGGLQSLELAGMLTVKIVDEKYGRIKLQVQVTIASSIRGFFNFFKCGK